MYDIFLKTGCKSIIIGMYNFYTLNLELNRLAKEIDSYYLLHVNKGCDSKKVTRDLFQE